MEHFFEKIHGWFTFPALYTEMVKAYNDAIFVEVGTWKGKSAAYMATEIANSGKNITFYCVDPWTGEGENATDYLCEEVISKTLYEHFLKNIEPVKDFLVPVKKKSLDAVKDFADNTIDFIYIDASHDYENVISDLRAWSPKLKKTGILAGHDYGCQDVNRAVNEFCSSHGVTAKQHHADGSTWYIEAVHLF